MMTNKKRPKEKIPFNMVPGEETVIVASAPLRLDLAGGGTDLLSYARQRGGVVVNATINKHVVVSISRRTDDRVFVKTRDFEFLGNRKELIQTRELVRHIVSQYGVDGLSLEINSDIPQGSGLGGSAAVGAALLRGLAAFNPDLCVSTPRDLAELAAQIEIVELFAPIGKQDQYAAAFGGINRLDFLEDDSVKVKPIGLDRNTLGRLNTNLMLFHLGWTRESRSILTVQHERSATNGKAIEILDKLKDKAITMAEVLNRADLDAFASLLGEVWTVKRDLSPNITNGQIERFYQAALDAGATSGKIMGAGGGGCFLLFCSPERQADVRAALQYYKEIPFEITGQKARI